MYTYRRWRTHTACGMRMPPTHRVRYAYATYGTCALIHAHTRFRRSQTISTVCVGLHHFSSVWVCRPTAQIKTRGWRRSDADCRFLLFCSNRGLCVNPRLSVTVALELTPPFWHRTISHWNSLLAAAMQNKKKLWQCSRVSWLTKSTSLNPLSSLIHHVGCAAGVFSSKSKSKLVDSHHLRLVAINCKLKQIYRYLKPRPTRPTLPPPLR